MFCCFLKQCLYDVSFNNIAGLLKSLAIEIRSVLTVFLFMGGVIFLATKHGNLDQHTPRSVDVLVHKTCLHIFTISRLETNLPQRHAETHQHSLTKTCTAVPWSTTFFHTSHSAHAHTFLIFKAPLDELNIYNVNAALVREVRMNKSSQTKEI